MDSNFFAKHLMLETFGHPSVGKAWPSAMGSIVALIVALIVDDLVINRQGKSSHRDILHCACGLPMLLVGFCANTRKEDHNTTVTLQKLEHALVDEDKGHLQILTAIGTCGKPSLLSSILSICAMILPIRSTVR